MDKQKKSKPILIKDNSLKIAIIGRANVGKSTLFNKLSGGKFAIVKDIAGTTRDTKETTFLFNDVKITLTDTAGLENIPKGSLPKFVKSISDKKEEQKEAQMYEQMIEKSLNAIKKSDISFFVIDGKIGVTQEDIHFVKIAKRFCNHVVLIVNKCESDNKIKTNLQDLISLGLGEPIYCSAEHSIGFAEIYDIILNLHNAKHTKKNSDNHTLAESTNNDFIESEVESESENEDRISLAIVGRPNAGKSSLINKIIGEDRLVTGDKAGITRDSIHIRVSHLNHEIKIIDTAGVRKALKINGDELEQLSTEETFRAIRLANIVALVVDVSDPFVTQDLHLAYKICTEGRGIVIIMNKWDKLSKEKQNDTKLAIEKVLGELVNEVSNPSVVVTSAIKGYGVDKILDEVINVYNNWNKRIKTPILNQWLKDVVNIKRPNLVGSKVTKIKYITQIKTRPPTFNLFVNITEGIDRSYIRFLSKRIGKDFSLNSVPIRIKIIKNKNNFVKNK